MDYLRWNKALVDHFFRLGFAGQPVYLCVTDGLIADLYRGAEGRPDAPVEQAMASFVGAAVAGPAPLTNPDRDIGRLAFLADASLVATGWAKREYGGLPPYVGYLALFVVACTRELEDVTERDYYARLNDLLVEHRYVDKPINTPVFKQTRGLWDRLADWANVAEGGRRGTFRPYARGQQKFVSLPRGQALLTSRDLVSGLPCVFDRSGLAGRDAVAPEAMRAALLRYADECGLSGRVQDFLRDTNRALVAAVVGAALYQLRARDGTAAVAEDRNGPRANGLPPAVGAGRRSVGADWELRVDHGRATLHLRVTPAAGVTGRLTLACRDVGGRSFDLDATTGEPVAAALADLVDAGLDVAGPLAVRAADGPAAAVPGLPLANGGPMLFRWPTARRYGWMAGVDADGGPVAANGLAVVLPKADAGRLRFGECPAPVSEALELPFGQGRVEAVRLLDVHTTEPRRLTLDGRTLCQVGPRPSIVAIDPADAGEVICLDDRDCVVIVGCDHVELAVADVLTQPQDHAWTCDGGHLAPHGATATLTASPDGWGWPIDVSVAGAEVTVLLLPPRDQWAWAADADPGAVARAAADGRAEGSLSLPNGRSLRLSEPLTKPVWWLGRASDTDAPRVAITQVFKRHADLIRHKLHAWVPTDTPLTLNGVPVGSVPGGVMTAIRLTQVLHGRFDLASGIGDDHIDDLRLGGDMIAKIGRVPDRPALTRSGGGPAVFLPREKGPPAGFALVWIRERHLVDGELAVRPCGDVPADTVTPVDCPFAPTDGEGVWLLLVKPVGGLLVRQPLRQLARAGIDPVAAMTVHPPNVGMSLRQRLGDPDAEGTKRARALLSFLAAEPLVGRHQVFAAAAAEVEELDAPADRAFWDGYFAVRENCQPTPTGDVIPLDRTLHRMLKGDFNWCAEPRWLAAALTTIDRECKWVTDRDQAMSAVCPLILGADAIANGYPFLPAKKKPPKTREHRLDRYLDFLEGFGGGDRLWIGVSGKLPQMPGHAQLMAGTAVCTGFDRGGARIKVLKRPSPMVLIDGAPGIEPDGWQPPRRFRVTIAEGRQAKFVDYWTNDQMLADDQGEIVPGQLDDPFAAGLASAEPLVGPAGDRGLGDMLRLGADRFREVGREQPSQRNRLVIFQAAVLSRLHARRPAGGKWAGWPLDNRARYRDVCHVLSQAWFPASRRDILMRDLIPVEWLLTWFGR